MIQVRGQGPDLVMLHGWGMHSGCWGSFADHLAARFTLHLVDLPGHGLSAGQTNGWGIEDLTSELLESLPGAAWLGWSLGGRIALQAALQQPTAIRRLVLISTNPCFIAARNWECGMDPQVFDNFVGHLEKHPAETLDLFNGLLVAGSGNARSTLTILREKCAETMPDTAALKSGLALLADSTMLKGLEKIRVPALVIGGSEDRLVPLEAVRRTAQILPRAVFVPIEGAGHASFISHRAEVLSAVTGFLARDKAA